MGARSASRQQALGRVFIYGALVFLALYYLMPLWVMITTSLKPLDEIYGGSFIGLPETVTTEAWRKAWSEACIGTECTGLKPYFVNSILMVVPAVILSTGLGALNGYVLTKWRFRGANLVFGLMLFGCFLPFQAVLLPMAQVLGRLGLSGSIAGLVFVHTVYGISFTTLFFRNYFVTIPDELTKAAQIDGAGFLRIFFSIMLPAVIPIIVVSCIWQFTQIWNDFLFGVSFTAGSESPITVALNNIVNVTTGRKQYNVDMASAQRLGTTIVYVTHDQIEAMTLATRIAVMKDGIVQQFGPPQEVYDRPATTYVARFVGSPAMNIIPGRLVATDRGPAAVIDLPDGEAVIQGIVLSPETASRIQGREVLVGIRPEHFILDPKGSLPVEIDVVEPTGPDTLAVFTAGATEVVARLEPFAVASGDTVRFSVKTEKVVLFDAETETRLD